MSTYELQQYAYQSAVEAGVDPGLYLSLIQSESSWNPGAIGKLSSGKPSGAVGIAQFTWSTAANSGVAGIPYFNPTDPYDSLKYGAIYLRDRIDRYGVKDGIARYKGYKSYTQSDNSKKRVDGVIDGAKSFVDKFFSPIETKNETPTITPPEEKKASEKKLWDYTFNDLKQSFNASFIGFTVGFVGVIIIVGVVWRLSRGQLDEVIQDAA